MKKIKTQIMIIGKSVQPLLAPTNLSRFLEIIQSFEFENLFIILWGISLIYNLMFPQYLLIAHCNYETLVNLRF